MNTIFDLLQSYQAMVTTQHLVTQNVECSIPITRLPFKEAI